MIFFIAAFAAKMTDVKTVRVTAAVYEGLDRLKPVLTHSHWAGLTDCTQDFSLAVGCVFVKQSLLPCY